MLWPFPLVWRYAVTSAVLALCCLAGARALDGLANVLFRSGVPSAYAPLTGAAATLSGTGVVAGVAVLGPLLAMAAWHRAARVRRRPRLHAVGQDADDRPFRRDLHAEIVVDRRGYLFAPRVLFTGTGLGWRSLRRLPRGYDSRFESPVPVFETRGTAWWIAGNEFYRVEPGYSVETVEAVVEALRWRRRSRLDAGQPEVAAGKRREELLESLLRPRLGRHHGLVCVRCRGTIDARDTPVAPLWTEVGLRASDAQIMCTPCRAEAEADEEMGAGTVSR